MLVRSPLLPLLIMLATKSYSVTHSRGDTVSQLEMDYSCVYHVQLFLPLFLLLSETYYCVPGTINCNKEYLTIMSSLTQYNDHQSIDFLL